MYLLNTRIDVRRIFFVSQIHPLTTTGWMPVLLLIVLNICVVKGIANLNRPLPSQCLPNGKNFKVCTFTLQERSDLVYFQE